MSEDIIERIRNARLVWAMVCECQCKACDEFYAVLQRICKDIPTPDLRACKHEHGSGVMDMNGNGEFTCHECGHVQKIGRGSLPNSAPDT